MDLETEKYFYLIIYIRVISRANRSLKDLNSFCLQAFCNIYSQGFSVKLEKI